MIASLAVLLRVANFCAFIFHTYIVYLATPLELFLELYCFIEESSYLNISWYHEKSNMKFPWLYYNPQTVKTLREGLSKRNIDHIEKRFRSDEGIAGITTDLFVS